MVGSAALRGRETAVINQAMVAGLAVLVLVGCSDPTWTDADREEVAEHCVTHVAQAEERSVTEIWNTDQHFLCMGLAEDLEEKGHSVEVAKTDFLDEWGDTLPGILATQPGLIEQYLD